MNFLYEKEAKKRLNDEHERPMLWTSAGVPVTQKHSRWNGRLANTSGFNPRLTLPDSYEK